MTESRAVVVTPDPRHPGWLNAHGRGLLTHAARIPTVEGNGDGIAYHGDVADEVRACLVTAGYRITDSAARTDPGTPTPARSVLGFYHEPGEELTCPKCTPSHAQAAALVRAEAIATVRASLAKLSARTADA